MIKNITTPQNDYPCPVGSERNKSFRNWLELKPGDYKLASHQIIKFEEYQFHNYNNCQAMCEISDQIPAGWDGFRYWGQEIKKLFSSNLKSISNTNQISPVAATGKE